MTDYIRDLSSEELHLFGDIVARLAEVGPRSDLREAIVSDIARLLRADFLASYRWCEKIKRYEHYITLNLEPSHVQRYDEWFQFRDPMTEKLRTRRKATMVEEVISREDLVKTEFYNDFLSKDGLSHGINMSVFDGGRHLRDFRIWRAHGQPYFSEREVGLLNALEPFLQRALLKAESVYGKLTRRESDVVALVARGCRDRDIARILDISFSTVRTHIDNALEKHGCANRAELATLVVHGRLDS
jgi:DNA-binding CsgD family transcriptional regulator